MTRQSVASMTSVDLMLTVTDVPCWRFRFSADRASDTRRSPQVPANMTTTSAHHVAERDDTVWSVARSVSSSVSPLQDMIRTASASSNKPTISAVRRARQPDYRTPLFTWS